MSDIHLGLYSNLEHKYMTNICPVYVHIQFMLVAKLIEFIVQKIREVCVFQLCMWSFMQHSL